MTDRPVMLIAGASGSVGAAVAREALREGWAVIAHGRTEGKVTALVEELRQSGPAEAIVFDFMGEEAAARLVDQAFAKFGQLDAVVDCIAGGPGGYRLTGLFKQTEPAGYTPFLTHSVAWFQSLAHAAYPRLAETGGTLIGFISDAGIFAAPNQTMVGAARAAEIGFIRNLAVEAARDGIRAHCISPSYVEGSDVAKRIGPERMAKAAKRAGLGLPTADDIAPITVFLCGPGAKRITGQVISINGGLNA